MHKIIFSLLFALTLPAFAFMIENTNDYDIHVTIYDNSCGAYTYYDRNVAANSHLTWEAPSLLPKPDRVCVSLEQPHSFYGERLHINNESTCVLTVYESGSTDGQGFGVRQTGDCN